MTNPVSISSVVAGDHPEGTVVSVTGVLNAQRTRKTKQGNEWATFLLIGEKTAVDVALLPKTFADFRDLIGPVKIPGEHPFTNLRPPTLTLTGRVDRRDCRPGVLVTDVVCAEHDSHAPHPPLPPIGQARLALMNLTSAAQSFRDAAAADTVTPIDELVRSTREALGQVWAVFADYDGNPLYERNQARFDADPVRTAWLDAEADDLANNLEPLVGDAKPSLPGPDGTRRASTRSKYRLFGWPAAEGLRA